MTSYTFGDSDLAADRLRIVAEVMEPVSRALLARVDASTVHDALDLGCGPGHTTRLLAAAFPDATVTGVDQSHAYVAAASRAAGPRARFVVADVASRPLPGTPADLVYARYLLSHLADVAGHVAGWCDGLRAGGWLVLEEPETIASSDPDFAAYEQVAASLVQSTGASFYAGPLIAELALPPGVECVLNDAVEIDLTAGQAAAMFWRNARAWDRDVLRRAGHDPTTVDGLAARLRAREHDRTRGLFDWRQRQVILRKSLA